MWSRWKVKLNGIVAAAFKDFDLLAQQVTRSNFNPVVEVEFWRVKRTIYICIESFSRTCIGSNVAN